VRIFQCKTANLHFFIAKLFAKIRKKLYLCRRNCIYTLKQPTISLIIGAYKNIDALRLIFLGLEQQSYKNFEVIVAEDNNSPEIAALVAAQQQKGVFPLKHVSQDDIGFRKNKILNAAIRASEGAFCTFIDGDCIPHKHFLKDISKHAQEKVILGGRRVMLSEKISKELYQKQTFFGSISFMRLFFGGSKHIEKGLHLPFLPARTKNKNVFGCNMTISKNDLVAVNGFDEFYEFPAFGEDRDIEWRLHQSGCKTVFPSCQMILYHLDHPSIYRWEDVEKGMKILNEKKQKNEWKNHEKGLV